MDTPKVGKCPKLLRIGSSYKDNDLTKEAGRVMFRIRAKIRARVAISIEVRVGVRYFGHVFQNYTIHIVTIKSFLPVATKL